MEDGAHDQLADVRDGDGCFPRWRKSKSTVTEGTIDCPKDSEDYPMTTKGICYIFNQKVFNVQNELKKTKLKERRGTNVDADLLEIFFEAINFDVLRYNDSEVDEVLFILQEACENGFREYSCFVCCILSYEAEPNKVYASNGKYPTKRIFEKFYANNCCSLIGKPKIFFIQACAIDSDPTVQRSIYQSRDSGFEDEYEIHTIADFLVVYSTVPGFYSWENTSKGSWFIEALFQTLKRQIGNMDLLQLLKIVNRKVLYDYQTYFGNEGMKLKIRVPCVTSTLTRNIKFPAPCSLVSKFSSSDSVFLYESDNYVMNCEREGTSKGKVYIFNHENFKETKRKRLGTNKDVVYLKGIFTEPDFDVQTFPDLGKEDILKEITNVASISHEDFSCFICCILTHGDDATLSARDGNYELDDIFSPFFDKWVGKPKIYFIQACRGNLLNSGVRVKCRQSTDSGDNTKDYNFLPFTQPDFLIAYATVPGDVSMRNTIEGSWFIKTLCNTLKKHGKNVNLQQLLTIVHRDVGIKFKSYSVEAKFNNKKQVPCLTSTLTKNVQF